jgi:hypothetical protein
MSAHLQSIVFAGMSPAGASPGASYWVDPAWTDSATGEHPVLRTDVPEKTGCQAIADETANPVDLSTSAAPGEASLEKTRGQAVADIVNAGLSETTLAAKDIQVEVTVRLPDSLVRRDFRLPPPRKQSHSVYVDAVIGASYWDDPSCTGFATAENPVLRIDIPEGTGCQAVANETADPVDSATSAAPDAGLPEKTRSQEVAGAVNTSRDTTFPAQAVQVEATVRSPDSLARRDSRLDSPPRKQSHSAVTAKPVDSSAFMGSEEAFLRRCLKPSLPPAYVDAVIRIVSRSRKEMVEALEKCLNQRARQLHQAVSVIRNLIREKEQLECEAVHLERTRSNLRKIHSTLRAVQHELVESRHKALTR